jgi:hypothetical protein
MTSIRESVRRLLRREYQGGPAPSAYSYRIHWMTLARGWNEERRRIVGQAVEGTIGVMGFEPSEVRRLYSVPELDASRHSGESLMALHEVLGALAREGSGRDR